MKSKILGALVVSAVFLSAGCSNSAPKCSDKETLDLVKEIAMDTLVEQIGRDFASKVSFAVNAIRTTDVNEKTGAQECAAELEISGPAGVNSIDITYTSEKTYKADEFYVTVYGL